MRAEALVGNPHLHLALPHNSALTCPRTSGLSFPPRCRAPDGGGRPSQTSPLPGPATETHCDRQPTGYCPLPAGAVSFCTRYPDPPVGVAHHVPSGAAGMGPEYLSPCPSLRCCGCGTLTLPLLVPEALAEDTSAGWGLGSQKAGFWWDLERPRGVVGSGTPCACVPAKPPSPPVHTPHCT